MTTATLPRRLATLLTAPAAVTLGLLIWSLLWLGPVERHGDRLVGPAWPTGARFVMEVPTSVQVARSADAGPVAGLR